MHLYYENLAKLGIHLPQAAAPAANYVPAILTGQTLYVSGQLPMENGAMQYVGKVGETISIDQAQAAAKLCAINILAQAEKALGSLEHIVQLVKLVGFVNSAPDFIEQPRVINGASDFMVAALGDAGRHARSAVSAAALPFGVAVEIEAIFTVKS